MKPTAAPAHFPYTEKDGHRTMARVMADERSERIAESHRRMLGRRK